MKNLSECECHSVKAGQYRQLRVCKPQRLRMLEGGLPVGRPENLAETAGDLEDFAGDPSAVWRGEKTDRGSNVAGLADASQRRLRNRIFLKVAAEYSQRVSSLGFNYAGINRVDADLPRAELFRQHMCDRVYGSFSRRIYHSRWRCN